jgi:hypothetical protein
MQPAFMPLPPQSQGIQNWHERTWVDRVLDLIVGEDAPSSKYALICENCFAHNGLCAPELFDQAVYECPRCHHVNSKKRKHPSPIKTPSPDLLAAALPEPTTPSPMRESMTEEVSGKKTDSARQRRPNK